MGAMAVLLNGHRFFRREHGSRMERFKFATFESCQLTDMNSWLGAWLPYPTRMKLISHWKVILDE